MEVRKSSAIRIANFTITSLSTQSEDARNGDCSRKDSDDSLRMARKSSLVLLLGEISAR